MKVKKAVSGGGHYLRALARVGGLVHARYSKQMRQHNKANLVSPGGNGTNPDHKFTLPELQDHGASMHM